MRCRLLNNEFSLWSIKCTNYSTSGLFVLRRLMGNYYYYFEIVPTLLIMFLSLIFCSISFTFEFHFKQGLFRKSLAVSRGVRARPAGPPGSRRPRRGGRVASTREVFFTDLFNPCHDASLRWDKRNRMRCFLWQLLGVGNFWYFHANNPGVILRIAAAVDLLSNGLSARYYRQVILRFVVSYMAFTICNFEYAVEYKYKIHSDWYKLALFCEWSINIVT